MKDFFKVATPAEVLAIVEEFDPLEAEILPTAEALGRVLAEEVRSPVDLPDFDRATMDGFAVRASDTTGASESSAIQFDYVDEVRMGEAPGFRIGRGQTAKIPTGGMLPEGADAVVMDEYSSFADARTVQITKGVAPLENVVRVGQDIRRDETLLLEGDVLRAQELGALCGLGVTSVCVRRKPRVAIVATGDEVVDPSETPRQGQIRDINRFTLSALTTGAGGVPVPLGIVGDDPKALEAAVRGAMEDNDVILISGGSSMGQRDHSVEIIDSLGEPGVLIHGVSIKPGKPLIVGRAGKKAVIGVPGHPVSNMMVFQVFLKPLLHRLEGRRSRSHEDVHWTEAALSRNLPSASGREDYIRVRLEGTEDGLLAHPVLGSSSMISTMVKADGFIIIGVDTEGLMQGERVRVYSF
ncbi:MAG: gephyrin-like molybdotransferase Glp [Nitrospinota bacterium]